VQPRPIGVRILLVDDEADNRLVYGDMIKAEGYSVRSEATAEDGLSSALKSPPDLILSDVAMPEADGLWLLSRLRAEERTARVPVILMSGVRTSEKDLIGGLDGGADDYLPKPVSCALLRAKIGGVLRRYGAARELEGPLTAHGLALDVFSRQVSVDGSRVALTRLEFDLLTMFLRKRGQALEISFLLESVWGYDPSQYTDPHTVGVHVWSLRKKIGPRIGGLIVPLPGLGYRFDG
jgi:two-component system alkaline phosphatase synthesis response regulator PhoP